MGGTAVIELARREAAINGVVSFHGGLDGPALADCLKIQSKILIFPGAHDALVPKAEIEAMQQFFDELFKK